MSVAPAHLSGFKANGPHPWKADAADHGLTIPAHRVPIVDIPVATNSSQTHVPPTSWQSTAPTLAPSPNKSKPLRRKVDAPRDPL